MVQLRLGILICLAAANLLAQARVVKPDPKSDRADATSTDNVIRFYEWRVGRDPEDYFNYDKLAVAYITKGRETGDVVYYELAEKALKKSLELESTHREAVSATAHLASVYFAEHRFQDALVYANKALGFQTGDLSPYATIGDAFLELGEYNEAANAYSKLNEATQSRVSHHGWEYLRETRASSLEFIQGHPKESIGHMRNAVQIAIEAQMPKESLAWTQFTLAEECFQTGNLICAEQASQDALATYPRYHHALAELARVRSAQKRFEEAIALYREALAVIPLPAYAAALGDLYKKLGRNAEARKEYDLVQVIAYLSTLTKTIYNRELAMFYTDHEMKLKEALELARREIEARHDVYTWDCLAWVLYKNKQLSQATEAIEKALSQGTVDALMFFHAGSIYAAAGNTGKAKYFLKKARSANPAFHVVYAETAAEMLAHLEHLGN